MQWGRRQGDREVFGEGLHRWQGQAEAKEAGGIHPGGQVPLTHLGSQSAGQFFLTFLVDVFDISRINHNTIFQVGEGYALVGRDTGPGKDCIWYGTTFCDGDLVEDLFRWWFRMKCSKSKFTVASVPYTQVVQDPRFKS